MHLVTWAICAHLNGVMAKTSQTYKFMTDLYCFVKISETKKAATLLKPDSLEMEG